jgi:uncharacterized DUF497 family protein
MVIGFEWDPKKAGVNWLKHKVSFEQAEAAFRDFNALDDVDHKEDYREERFNLTGMVGNRLLVVTYT